MSPRHVAELLTLAALWGASFLLMRLHAGEFGPLALTAVRVSFAAALLLPLAALRGQASQLRQHWRAIAAVGIVNSALPFIAYAYAALFITAGLSSIFNATSPLWGAVIGWWWLSDRLTRWRWAGLAIGFVGVAWLAWDSAGYKPAAGASPSVWPVVACLLATLCYGWGANLTKRYLAGVSPLAVAAGSQFAAALVLAIPAAWAWPTLAPSPMAWGAAAVLGMVCTGWAYLLYFRLIAQVGPARAISVTFLIPMFAVLWGGLFLHEAVTPVMALACAVILLGTALATGAWRPGRPPTT